jgi:hypothetical protein
MKIDSPTAIGTSTGFGIPTGGTTNQVLSKVNSSDFNTQWIDNGAQATYLAVQHNSGQSIPHATVTTVTGWTTPVTSINAGEWNGTTGIFTATKSGVYLMTANLTYANATDTLNIEYGVNIAKNGSAAANARIFTQLNQTGSSLKQTNTVSFIYSLVPGDTLSAQAYQASGSSRTLHPNGNTLTIQELPSRVVR